MKVFDIFIGLEFVVTASAVHLAMKSG